jgi:hypothetical protein
MIVRSPEYPNDVSIRYPKSLLRIPRLQASDRIEGLVVNPDTGDLTNDVLGHMLTSVLANTIKTLGYCDLIDLAQETAETHAVAQDGLINAVNQRIAGLDGSLTAVKNDVAALRTSVDTLISFLGVIVPAWINKDEVENGDDLGIARPSAASLQLLVTFVFDQREPGFGHEDVVSIDPPAGTLVARGSTITVTLNLLG